MNSTFRLNNILKKKMHRQAIILEVSSSKDNKSFKSITYMGMPSRNTSSFLKTNFHTVFKTANTLSRFIENCKEETYKKYHIGVCLRCGPCQKKYIGETARKFVNFQKSYF